MVTNSIENATQHKSKLSDDILTIKGMSGIKVRHFLNNLIYDGSKYLEIGCWRGSTLCSALYNNNPSEAISIDNFSEFGGPMDELNKNIKKYVTCNHRHINLDCFAVDIEKENINNIDIYFYDGRHYTDDQYQAVRYYINAMNDVFIMVIDDWGGIDQWDVLGGTMKAIKSLNLKTHFYKSLPDYKILMKDRESKPNDWWNGLGVFVLEKQL